ncbi:alpha/beta fold hydrolase [Microbacterium marinilacus]|uniref:Alpha/beta hydrolase n=1 Tax=Microbacterium marinilacus TaxID=415209 RepID=A0ABP7BF21_9MICO|nr:alpha/beta hydrolase [Microbacterium marinilacus]
MPTRRIDVDLGWGTISALEWPAPERADAARTVLLLHGGGADSAWLSWGDLGERLSAAGHRVIAPDHPGFGHSATAPWPATQERLVAYVGDLVDALALDRYAVGGLSLGGALTLGHVLDRPARAAGAMLVGTYGIMPRLGAGLAAPAVQLASWAMVRSGLMTPLMRAYATSAARMERGMSALVRDPARRTPDLIDAVLEATRREGALETFAQWQRSEVGWRRLRTDYTPRLSELRTPVLMVHGERDDGVPLPVARAAAGLLPRAELVVAPGAGHWVQRDAPDLSARSMIAFLDRLEW